MPRADLANAFPVIAPSMLKCDFANLANEIRQLEDAGARLIHWDVMDGHFVQNLSYGALLIEKLRPMTDMVFDAHLMISDPQSYLEDYLKAGCDWITIHIEACPHPTDVLKQIRDAGRLAGLAINPDTPIEKIQPHLDEVDVVLVMSVHPGFGGQSFIPGSTDRVKQIRQLLGSDKHVSIDGGIGPATIAQVAQAGADVFVAGSSIFDHSDYRSAINEMVDLAVAGRESKGTF